MKILREQFKNIESNYNKNKKQNFINDKRYRINSSIKTSDFSSSTNPNNFNNMSNMYGSYIHQNNNINLINNNLNENFYDDVFIEEFNIIISLWEELGVTDSYMLIFENLSKEIDQLMRKDLFESEISSLKKFSDLLFVIIRQI